MAVLPPDPVFTLKGTMGYVHCLCFVPPAEGDSPSHLIAGTEAGYAYFWNLKTSREIHKLDVGPSILSVLHTNDNVMITQEKLGSIKMWQKHNDSQYSQISSLTGCIGFCRCILSQNQYLAVAQENSAIEIFDIHNSSSVMKFVPDENDKLGNVMCLKHISYNENDFILAGYETGDMLLWTPKNGKFVSRIKLRECLTSIDFDIITGRGISGNMSKYIQIFTIDRNLEITLKCELTMTNEGCNVVKLRNDRKVFVAGGKDGYLRIYSWRSLRPLAVLTEHKDSIADIVFSESPVLKWNMPLMAATGADGVITLWNLYN